MSRSIIVGENIVLVFGLMVRRRLNDNCMRLNWGSELMMIRIRIACKSRGLVFGLLVGRTIGFDDDCMPLNSTV